MGNPDRRGAARERADAFDRFARMVRLEDLAAACSAELAQRGLGADDGPRPARSPGPRADPSGWSTSSPSYTASRAALDARFPHLADDARPGESRAWLPLSARGHAYGVLLLVWPDAVVMPDGGTAVLVGDVVGHDMGAAAAMGRLRSMLA